MEIKKTDIDEILVSEEEINEICNRLAKQISEDYKDKKLYLICILKGSLPFTADIMKRLTCDCILDFMSVSSYNGTQTSGFVNIKKDLDTDVSGCDVLIIEDILETGITLSRVKEILIDRGVNSVKICTLLDKSVNRTVDIEADYVGKVIPDKFVIGYGLDYNEKYRNLPFVGVLSSKVYADK